MYLLKPENCCYPNCFECPYDDCEYDGVEVSESKLQDEFDKDLEAVEPSVKLRRKRHNKYNKSDKGKERLNKYNKSDKGKERQKNYEESKKGKERQRKYNLSAKGKERTERYLKSEKGIENEKRKAQKKIASGKNAEYCKRYYYKKKLAMQNA